MAEYNAKRYTRLVIRSFRDDDTRRLFGRERVTSFDPRILRVAQRKLAMLDAAAVLADLRGQHSIRINDQWRICFVWTDAGPDDVEIVDYH